MSLAHFRDVTIGVGPGSRGDSCDICIQAMEATEATITHTTCQNTYHRSCFDQWTNLNDSQHQPTTCPKCRVVMREPADDPSMSPSLDSPYSASNWDYQYVLSYRRSLVSDFDYDLQPRGSTNAIFPTGPLLRRFDLDPLLVIEWLDDYSTRIVEVEGQHSAEARQRFHEYLILLVQARAAGYGLFDHEQLLPGETLTDLEIVPDFGSPRPRQWLLDWWQSDLPAAQQWLTLRNRRIQLALGLHQELVDRFQGHICRMIAAELDMEGQTMSDSNSHDTEFVS
jgi:Ring finger domain